MVSFTLDKAHAHDIAIGRYDRMGNLAFARDAGMFGLMHIFAMDRDRRGRADPLIEFDQLFLGRMTRDMDEFLLGGDDLDPAL